MKIDQVVDETIKLIETMCSKERAQQIFELLAAVGDEKYFSAPASSKENFHNSFPGGLAEHNLNVVKNLKKLVDTFDFKEISDEEICVAGLLHDFGKVENPDGMEYYTATKEKWKKERGENYDHNAGSVYFPTSQRTMYLLQKYNFKLSPKEYQAILLNDGMALEGNRVYNFRQADLSVLLHMADLISTTKEKQEISAKND